MHDSFIGLLQRMAKWGKATGILMMIGGGFSALSGLIFFIIGAIPGAVTMYLGYLIYKSGESAKEYLQYPAEAPVANILDKYSRYIFVSAIMMIVSFSLAILGILFYVFIIIMIIGAAS